MDIKTERLKMYTEADRQYKQSEAGKLSAKRYRKSKLGRVAMQRHNNTEKQKTARKHYEQSLIGCIRRRFYAIKQRCNNPKHPAYKYYGGRGIELKFTSDEFVDYVINELKIDPRGLDIDRIDNNKHYEPGNIRFVTHKENCNNKRQRRKNA